MKQSIEFLFAFALGILAPAPSAFAEVSNFRATTDDRHHIEGHGYSVSGNTETFIIAAAERKGKLTPRVERWFDGKGEIHPGRGVYTFSATYKIDVANNTTIFQLLNHDPKSDDVYKPLCFITAFPSDDGTAWHIHRSNKTSSPLLATIRKTESFVVKLETDGTRYLIWINDKHVVSSDFPREGKGTSMRYGAYHHGKGLATIHVTDAKFQLHAGRKLVEPEP